MSRQVTPQSPPEAEGRRHLASRLRYAADCLEREGVNEVRLWTAEGVCLAALNDIHREIGYGRPGKGIDDLLGGSND